MMLYFGYDPGMQRISCDGNEDLMRQELDAGRPILMSGYPRPGTGLEDGHAFVCDGYAENDYFHFNFGWSGDDDGYYLLKRLTPGFNDYSADQTAWIGLQPSLLAVEEGQAFINVNQDGMGLVVGGYGEVNVPATVEKDGKSYPVMKVIPYAFDVPESSYASYFEQHLQEYLTKITLPESVTEIGAMAFPSSKLKEVNLPNSIRKIGARAFFYSSYLEKVSIPSIEAWLNIDFEPYPLREDFDYIFIDCPPSLGLLTVNSLVAADSLLIPIQCEFYALEGLSKLLESMRMVKGRLNPSLEVFGVVMTMFDARTTLSKQVVEEVRDYFGDKVFQSVIPRNVKLSEAPSHGLPVNLYAPSSKGAVAYASLAEEVVAHG
jgi:hypothetical protein